MEDRGMRSRASRVLLWLAASMSLAMVAGPSFCQQPQSSQPSPVQAFRLIAKYNVGGDGGWDYLSADSIARRLYIARSNRVIVLDLDKGTVAGEIPNTNGVHGVAVASELRRGFASCGRPGQE